MNGCNDVLTMIRAVGGDNNLANDLLKEERKRIVHRFLQDHIFLAAIPKSYLSR